jgi:hypothetical protein
MLIPASYSTCLNLDHVPVGEPVVIQELGHVVPDPVRQDYHALLPRLNTQVIKYCGEEIIKYLSLMRSP